MIDNNSKFAIYGQARGGQHGVANWFLHQLGKSVLYYNNSFICKTMISYTDTVQINRDKPGNIKAYGFENKPIIDTHPAIKPMLGKDNVFPLVIIRDFANQLASLLNGTHASEKQKHNDLKSATQYWLRNIQYYQDHPEDCILFNKWFKSKQYKIKIMKRYIEDIDEDNIEYKSNVVMKFGGGSSFDGRKFDGSANKMDVLNRYKNFLDNKTFQKYYIPEIKSLNKQVFGIDI